MKKIDSLLLLVSILALACNAPKSATPDSSQQTDSNSAVIDSSARISEYVVSIYEDKSGTLWFGTMSDGVVRFDGTSLKYFTTVDGLVDNTVAVTTQDKSGNLWFGTHAGASRYKEGAFTNYNQHQGLHGSGCKFLVDNSGTLWAATYDGVFRFMGGSFVEFILPIPEVDNKSYKMNVGAVWRIMQDSKGNIWFGRDTYGACKYDGTTFTHYTKKEGLCSNNVCGIAEDKQGNIWFGCLGSDFPNATTDGGVCMMSADTLVQFPKQAGLANNDIYMIRCDNAGNPWICAGGVGVYRYMNGSFTLFNQTDRPDLIPKYYAQSFLEDSKRNLWFGFSGGLFRLEGEKFMHVTQGGIFK